MLCFPMEMCSLLFGIEAVCLPFIPSLRILLISNFYSENNVIYILPLENRMEDCFIHLSDSIFVVDKNNFWHQDDHYRFF